MTLYADDLLLYHDIQSLRQCVVYSQTKSTQLLLGNFPFYHEEFTEMCF